MQDCVRVGWGCARGCTGGPSHFPPAWAPLSLASGNVWQPASLVQVCSGKMDRNAPLGEHLAFFESVGASSLHVPCACAGQMHGHSRALVQGLKAKAANIRQDRAMRRDGAV